MIAGQSEIKRNIMLTEVKGNWWMQSRLMKVNKLKKYVVQWGTRNINDVNRNMNNVMKIEIWIT